jgi:hypothetical protein
VGNNRAHLPLEPAPVEPARGKSQGQLPKGPRAPGPHRRKSQPAKQVDGPAKRRIPPHLEADISRSDRDALTGLPFS